MNLHKSDTKIKNNLNFSEKTFAYAQKPGTKMTDFIFSKPKMKFKHTCETPYEKIMSLQRTIGNQNVRRLIRSNLLEASSNTRAQRHLVFLFDDNRAFGTGHYFAQISKLKYQYHFGKRSIRRARSGLPNSPHCIVKSPAHQATLPPLSCAPERLQPQSAGPLGRANLRRRVLHGVIRWFNLGYPVAPLFRLLRRRHGLIKSSPDLGRLIRRLIESRLNEPNLWNALALLRFGQETQWPIPIRGRAPMSKGRLFHAIRTWRDPLGKAWEAQRTPKYAGVLSFVSTVFRHGDRIYATYLVVWGSEWNWDPWVVKQLATRSDIQPRVKRIGKRYPRPTYAPIPGAIPKTPYVKLTYTDIEQGYLGDCYLMAALAAIAKQKPTLLAKMIKRNPNGTVTVRFFDVTPHGSVTNRVRFWVTILPGFPVWRHRLAYARTTRERQRGPRGRTKIETWVPIIEKAYAIWKGRNQGYKGIVGGWPLTVFREFTGRRGKLPLYIGTIDRVRCGLSPGTSHHTITWAGHTRTVTCPTTPARRPKTPIRHRIPRVNAAALASTINTELRDKRPLAICTFTIPKSQESEHFWKQYARLVGSQQLHDSHCYAITGIQGTRVTLYDPHREPNRGVLVKTTTQLRHLFERLDIGPKLGR